MNNDSIYLEGHWAPGGGAAFSSTDPSSGETIWSGNAATPDDVSVAFRSARAIAGVWGTRPFAEREAIVRRFAELLAEHKESLATTIARETGKPLWETRTEVGAMINKVDISVKAYWQRTGVTENQNGAVMSAIRHKPHGVVAVFGPYNFPGHLPNGHIVPALLAGNCVIFKPSEQTPLVAIETVKLWHEAGIPEGVLSLLPGELETAQAIAQHPQLDGLYFTGSSRTGAILNRQFADTPGKILALEMGGNNPLVVGKVNDILAAVYDVIQSAYLSSGQRCTCARRLFVPAGPEGDFFLTTVIDAIRKIMVGRWNDDPQPFMGPLISAAAAQQLLDAEKNLVDLGAEVLVPMQRLPYGEAFLTPGLLDVTRIDDLPDEEHFGPLLKVIRYDDFDDAITQANATRYGLSAGLLSEDEAQWNTFYANIRAGIVNWNRQTTGASSAAPFGGVGESGNHRASALYAADYCAFPVSSMEAPKSELPTQLAPGIELGPEV
ncbi:MAG: succinylglutamate-semialdehyde dehydrogenase [Pseudomonadota bacterium]|jgi:succinylglutamic semialdehyde dehydrogenase|nr:succinylglutamate-semialdehyde dehydrogenase [Pseudomonadota bacterium]